MQAVRQHPTIFGVIVLAVIVFLWTSIGSESTSLQYGVIPLDVEHAWTDVLNGDGDTSSVGVLLTTVTAMFLHAGPTHLIMNMALLWMFGALASEYLGKSWALGSFFVCGISGFVVHILLNRGSAVPCIGASGAVCGFEGIYLGMALRWRLAWPDVWPLAHPVPPSQLGLFAVVGICFDLWGLAQTDQIVAFGAHIGGFASGLVIACVVTQLYPTLQRWNASGRGRG